MSARVLAERPAAAEPAAAGLPRSTLLALLLSTALVPLGSTMIAVALPAIGRELAADPAALTQWLVNSYLVVAIVLQSPAGKLGDLWGTRRALLAGQALFALGAALGFFAASLAVLVLARVMMAAGGALLVPASMALLRNASAPAGRARLFGMFGAAMGLAAALGPLLGGVLVEAFGWRSLFLASLAVLAVASPLVRGIPAAPPQRARVPFDWIGSAILGAGLLSAVAGSKAGGTAAAMLLGFGAVLLFAFVRWERRVSDPVIDPALFRATAFAAGGIVVALHNLVMYALLFQLPIWLNGVLGSGSATTGRVLLAMMLSMVICSPIGGRASERFGARAVAVAGTLAILGGLLLLAQVAATATALGAVPALVLVGAGLGLASAPAQSSAVSAISSHQSGMAAGALSTMRYIGGVAGIGALGFILRDSALLEGSAALEVHLHAVWLFAGVMLVAVLPSALLPGRQA
jgi:MFS family permease